MFGKKKKKELEKNKKEEAAREKQEEVKKAEKEKLSHEYYYARQYDLLRASGLSDEEAKAKLAGEKKEIKVEISSSTTPQNLNLKSTEKEVKVEEKEKVQKVEKTTEKPAEPVKEAPSKVETKEESSKESEAKEVKKEPSVKRTLVTEKVISEEDNTKSTNKSSSAKETTAEEKKEEKETPTKVEEKKEEKEMPTKVEEKKEEGKTKEVKEAPVSDDSVKVLVEQAEDDKTNGKYEIFQYSDGFKYRLVASNGQTMATSEVYTTVRGAQNGIETLKANKDTLVTRIETDKHKKSQFVGSTVQNKILIHSANYTSRTQAESAINSVKNLIPATKIVLVKETTEGKPELVDRSKFLKEDGKGKYLIVVNAETNAYQFVLKASNGQVIVTSKQYKSVLSCKSAITKFRSEVKNGTFYTVKDKNGQYQFRLYSQANKLVQSGISYSTKAKCISNIESICRFIDSDIIEK